MVILIVDDSKAMRRIVIHALKLAGITASATPLFPKELFQTSSKNRIAGHSGVCPVRHHLLEAENGREALQLIPFCHPDLVISDWNMPEMKGIDLLRTLRRTGEAVPFGFITSENGPEIREEAFAAGAAFVITKPFTPRLFNLALQPLLSRN